MTNVFNDDVVAILDTIPALIFTGRADGYVDYVNRSWLDYIGAAFESLEGSGWIDYVHPDDRDAHLSKWQSSMQTGDPAISEARYLNAKGEYRWMLVHTKPLRDTDGKIVRWIAPPSTSVSCVGSKNNCRRRTSRCARKSAAPRCSRRSSDRPNRFAAF